MIEALRVFMFPAFGSNSKPPASLVTVDASPNFMDTCISRSMEVVQHLEKSLPYLIEKLKSGGIPDDTLIGRMVSQSGYHAETNAHLFQGCVTL